MSYVHLKEAEQEKDNKIGWLCNILAVLIVLTPAALLAILFWVLKT